MPLLEWDEKFNLGVEQFDTHHRHMVILLNHAYDNFIEDSSVEGLAARLDELFDYAIRHFHFEAKFLEETSYAGYAEHLELHRRFSVQVAAMREDLQAGWANLPLEMLNFLKNWLTYNILFADANYVRSAYRRQWKQCA